MKIRFLCTHKSSEDYFRSAVTLYEKKINHYCPFEFEVLKPKGIDRAQAEKKKELESQTILDKIGDKDWVILFDEKGKSFSSEEFSAQLVKGLEMSRPVTFVVGGAFGASDALKSRADLKVSLSSMVMNHLVATTMSLEQIYRALTIWKGIPYHNV